jgi:UDP-N-acetylglucosamine 4,6-dehydratase
MINKKILIIGGTGALGQTLTKRYIKDNKIIIFSRDEHKQVNLSRKFPNVIFHIGDVKDKDSLLQALNEYKPDVIINTAALKHVPVCEDNPYESVKTNIIGHKNLIDCVNLSQHKIETLMFISTDKACKPLNVYGMCKAISERLYVDFANKQNNIKVVLCRYGNVLESTGSVIPYFKQLLEDGSDHLPITHVDMTRFLLTLEQATELIDWAYNFPKSHGCIAIPKVRSMKVTDIAKSLIKSYKKESEVDLKVIGIRPGEKMHEEMISTEEWLRTKKWDNYLIGTDYITDDMWSYNSEDSLMDDDQTYKFLIDSGVIQ